MGEGQRRVGQLAQFFCRLFLLTLLESILIHFSGLYPHPFFSFGWLEKSSCLMLGKTSCWTWVEVCSFTEICICFGQMTQGVTYQGFRCDVVMCSGIDPKTSVSRPVVTYSSGSPLSTSKPPKHPHHSGWETAVLFVCLVSCWVGDFISLFIH